MLARKRLREKGKVKLSKYFQHIVAGDKVVIKRDTAFPTSFPKRLQGRTGTINGMRGKSYVVSVQIGGKVKKFITKSIHLKKIKTKGKEGKARIK